MISSNKFSSGYTKHEELLNLESRKHFWFQSLLPLQNCFITCSNHFSTFIPVLMNWFYLFAFVTNSIAYRVFSAELFETDCLIMAHNLWDGTFWDGAFWYEVTLGDVIPWKPYFRIKISFSNDLMIDWKLQCSDCWLLLMKLTVYDRFQSLLVWFSWLNRVYW